MAKNFNKMKMSDVLLFSGMMLEEDGMTQDEMIAFNTQLVDKLRRFHGVVIEMEKADADWLVHITKMLREVLES